MLPQQIKKSKTNASQQTLNNSNNYMIKIDYFDKKGTKNFENNIPLTYILKPAMELHK